MLSRARRAIARRLRDESGFTLIEMLSSLIAASVVMTAIVVVTSVALNQSTRVYTKVDASERAMGKLEQLENDLHSACVVDNEPPIQLGSDSSDLEFISYFGDASSPTSATLNANGSITNGMIWHDLVYANGTLTDYIYTVAGTAPNYAEGTPLTTNNTGIQILTNVSQNGSNPVFQYFAYQEVSNGSGGYYSDGAGNPYEMLVDGTTPVPGTNIIPTANPLSTPLTSTTVLTAAEVTITLMVGPEGDRGENTSLSDAGVPITDSVVFRLTPPANHVETGATFDPCQ